MSLVSRMPFGIAACSLPLAASAAALVFDGHTYEYVDAPGITWFDAQGQASSLAIGDVSGHLVTITSEAENDFVTSLLPFLTDVGAYLGGVRTGGGPVLTEGWTWITGEEWSYTNWAPFEPNDENGEMYLVMWLGSDIYSQRPRGGWNDGHSDGGSFISGYVIEWDVPETSVSIFVALAAGALLLCQRKVRQADSAKAR